MTNKPRTPHARHAEVPASARPHARLAGGSPATDANSALDAVLNGPVGQRDSRPQLEVTPERITGVVIGRIVECTVGNPVRVAYPLQTQDDTAVPAATTVSVSTADLGRQVALLFEGGNPKKPIIIGFMQQPGSPAAGVEAKHGSDSVSLELSQDGKRISLSAEEEITLRCGDASVTLTRAGKILLKGKFLSSHSSGVNRIRGGSIQLN